MNIKKIRRKCEVRGCKNTDCFAISKVNEVGNSVIICPDCLREGLEAVDGYVPEAKKGYTPPPPLFFNGSVQQIIKESPEMEVKQEDDEAKYDTEASDEAENADNADGDIFKCPICQKEYRTVSGLEKHMAKHEEDKI